MSKCQLQLVLQKLEYRSFHTLSDTFPLRIIISYNVRKYLEKRQPGSAKFRFLFCFWSDTCINWSLAHCDHFDLLTASNLRIALIDKLLSIIKFNCQNMEKKEQGSGFPLNILGLRQKNPDLSIIPPILVERCNQNFL